MIAVLSESEPICKACGVSVYGCDRISAWFHKHSIQLHEISEWSALASARRASEVLPVSRAGSLCLGWP